MIHYTNPNRLILSAVLIIYSVITSADDWASQAFTQGTGRIEIAKKYLFFSIGKSYEARIPNRVEEGTRIRIAYKDEGRWIETDFVVAGISTQGELCRIHNKLPSRYSTSVGDTIYVEPCRYQ